MRQGHEFKIDLEDDVPPVHRPLYKMSPLELEEAKKQIGKHARAWLRQTIGFSLRRPNLVRTQEEWEPSVLH